MKVILFGASGNLGRKVAEALSNNGFETTVVLRDQSKSIFFNNLNVKITIANPLISNTLNGICSGFDLVISTFGKSVTIKDFSSDTFDQVDFEGNMNILNEAQSSRIRKFIYVSAFGAEKNTQLTYFRVHHEFSEKLKASGINFCIIKPPAIFSAYLEVAEMAKTGFITNIGNGYNKTNPIYEGDIAKVIISEISGTNKELDIGGKFIYSRKQLLEIIRDQVNPGAKIMDIPPIIIKFLLVLLWLVNRNAYHKMAFISKAMQEDLIAPQVGELSFEEYFKL